MKLKMGEWYEINGYAYKEIKKINEEMSYLDKIRGRRLPDRERRTKWLEVSFEKPVNAMFIGSRTVWDVFAHMEYDYEFSPPGSWWENERLKQHRVHLFVLNAQQNPIRVFEHQIILKKDQE